MILGLWLGQLDSVDIFWFRFGRDKEFPTSGVDGFIKQMEVKSEIWAGDRTSKVTELNEITQRLVETRALWNNTESQREERRQQRTLTKKARSERRKSRRGWCLGSQTRIFQESGSGLTGTNTFPRSSQEALKASSGFCCEEISVPLEQSSARALAVGVASLLLAEDWRGDSLTAKAHLGPRSPHWNPGQDGNLSLGLFFFQSISMPLWEMRLIVYLQGRVMLAEKLQKGTMEKCTEGDKELGPWVTYFQRHDLLASAVLYRQLPSVPGTGALSGVGAPAFHGTPLWSDSTQ